MWVKRRHLTNPHGGTKAGPQHILFNIIYQSARRHHAFLITYYILRPDTHIYRACKKISFLILLYRVFYINILHPDKILT